jgi:tRNA threonylcarbamoyladenosine biosynthesis protein TsaE
MGKNTKVSYFTNKTSATKKLGENLAETIIRTRGNGPVIVGLDGDLGSGKTTFLQGFAKGLGIKEKILSPTFVIVKRFEIKKKISKYKNFYHIDCYRIEGKNELKSFNFKSIIADKKSIIAIEWVKKINKIIPYKNIAIKFSFLDKNKRKVVLSGMDFNGTIKS